MATATDDTRTRNVVDHHANLRASLLLQLLKALLGLWGGFKGWDNPDLVSGQVARSATLVDATLAKARALARSYATTVLRDLDASPQHPLPPVQNIYQRSGVTQQDVYARPAEQYAWAISQGKTDAEAWAIAQARLKTLAEMDVAAAERDELETIWKLSDKVIGHRRLIHPERSVSGTCGLCVVAATRFYTQDDLSPLHDKCKCTEFPVVKGDDPGLRLNDADLQAIYDAAGSTAAADLKRTRVAIQEHGELGPILVRDGQNFRDVTQVNRSSRKKFTPFKQMTIEDQRKSWAAMKASSERSIAKLETARDNGETTIDLAGTGKAQKVNDWDAAIMYHRALIDRMNSLLK